MDKASLECVYASGVTIQDPSLLATMAVFYDKVSLPHAYDLDPDARELIRWPSRKWSELELCQKYYSDWKTRYGDLFEAGVLQVLPPPWDPDGADPDDMSRRLLDHLGSPASHFTSSQVLDGHLALAMLAIYGDHDVPEYLSSRPGDGSTAHLRSVLATSLLSFSVPRIGQMGAQDILAVRDEIADHKEGFVQYVNTQIRNLRNEMRETAGDEREAANRLLQEVMVPDFKEFLAQDGAERMQWWAGFIGRAADAAGTVLKVVLMPWEWNNLPDLVSKPAQLVADAAGRRVERKSHRVQAFQYLGKVHRLQRA